MEIRHGPNAFKSDAEPHPLSFEEEAMLCMAATGMSGMNLADMPHTRREELAPDEVWDGNCNTMLEYSGRTFPSPCGSHGTELFYTDDVVDDVIERKWGEQGIFNPARADGAPYKKPGEMEQQIPKTDPAYVECTKDILKYVWKKWGRLPVFADACIMTLMVQAHHLETRFYDEYYRGGAYTERHRRHMEHWHGRKKARLEAA